MPELQYSREALGALKRFHRCDAIVYVEGDDDELFWRTVFQKCTNLKIEPKPQGGSANLDAQIERIIDEDLPVLAARDADFLVCTGRQVADPRIVYTWGYAIENTLYIKEAVNAIAHSWSRGRNGDLSEECKDWFACLARSFECLIKYDAANFHHDIGCEVLGDSFVRYSTSEKSREIDITKVQRQEKATAKRISTGMANGFNLGAEALGWIRGHFLQSAVLQFVAAEARKSGNNKSPTYAGLYSESMMYLSHKLKTAHPHFRHYKTTTVAAAKSIGAHPK